MIPRRALLALLLIFFSVSAAAETAENRDILPDGDSSDFADDESLFNPSEELAFDSWWGENNDIYQVKVSWDSDELFVAVDGRCWDNNILFFFDTDSLTGIRDMDRLNAWSRKLEFFERRPDMFLGTWDRGTWPDAPQLWKLEPGATETVVQIPSSAYQGASTFSQGQTGASMEAVLPWAELYSGDLDTTVPPGAEIAVVAVLVTGSDHNSGPDCAPNNVLGMPQNEGDYAIIDNFAVLRIDRDDDGEPDMGVSPGGREGDEINSELPPLSFLSDPAAPKQILKFLRARATRAAFSPNGDGIEDEAELAYIISTKNFVTVAVHDLHGELVASLAHNALADKEVEYSISWDGRDESGRKVEAGIYFARFTTGRSERVIVPLAVLR